MKSQTGKQRIAYTQCQQEGNKAMKYDQLIELIFCQKSCRKWGRETSSRSISVF